MRCPICAGDTLTEYNGRPLARCASCDSIERTRYVWLYLQKAGVLKPGRTFWHFGPEQALIGPLYDTFVAGYRPMDLNPDHYRNPHVAVKRFDLVSDLPKIGVDSVDAILANHVLEHLPCSVEDVLRHFLRVLRPGGDLVMTIPVSRRPDTIEDLNPALSGAERERLFWQDDHMRLFGQDVRDFMAGIFGTDVMIDGREYFSESELENCGIPAANVSRLCSESIFHYRKPGDSLLP